MTIHARSETHRTQILKIQNRNSGGSLRIQESEPDGSRSRRKERTEKKLQAGQICSHLYSALLYFYLKGLPRTCWEGADRAYLRSHVVNTLALWGRTQLPLGT